MVVIAIGDVGMVGFAHADEVDRDATGLDAEVGDDVAP